MAGAAAAPPLGCFRASDWSTGESPADTSMVSMSVQLLKSAGAQKDEWFCGLIILRQT